MHLRVHSVKQQSICNDKIGIGYFVLGCFEAHCKYRKTTDKRVYLKKNERSGSEVLNEHLKTI